MEGGLTRRAFVGSIPLLPLAAREAIASQAAQAEKPPFPIIDTHIHIFDKTRPEGAPYPRDMPQGGEPPQGMIALPNRYKAIVAPFGVVGAIIVEASPRVEDNQWLLDISANHPVIVGLVGRIDPVHIALQANVHEDEIGMTLCRLLDRFLAGARHGRNVTLPSQRDGS